MLFTGAGSGATGSAQTNKYVIFREDDVAPNADFAELQAVNQVNINMNVPVVMGIIPHPYPTPSGNQLIEVNHTFLEYMRSLTSNHLFQFAQHGYTHQDLGPSPRAPVSFMGGHMPRNTTQSSRGATTSPRRSGSRPLRFSLHLTRATTTR